MLSIAALYFPYIKVGGRLHQVFVAVSGLEDLESLCQFQGDLEGRGSRNHKTEFPDVILHVFPKSFERIKQWLLQTGQEFEDLDVYAQRILEEKKNDNYRICSAHFTPDCYTLKGNNKALRMMQYPMISESIFYRPMRRMRRAMRLAQEAASQASLTPAQSAYQADPSLYRFAGVKSDACTQTDISFFTADPVVHYPETEEPEEPMKDEPTVDYVRILLKDEPVDETCPPQNFSPPLEGPSNFTHSKSVAHTAASIVKTEPEYPGYPMETTPQGLDVTLEEDLSEDDMVQERKFLVFESCLDALFYKLPCGAGLDCTASVAGFKKHIDGSFVLVTGYCSNGHIFQLWQSQPRLECGAVGNVLLSAAILLSGSNFQKVHEMNNLLGLQQISQRTYYKYQRQFLFPTIDHHWFLEHQRVKREIGEKPVCVAGDALCGGPRSNTKHCAYTMMDLSSKKIVDFETSPLAGCSPFSIEKTFQSCLDRILDEELDVHIVATDCNAGIKKLIREKYAFINHQYNIWHYVKGLKKDLVTASKVRECEDIASWIHPIINHFWWSVKTCGGDETMLRERWQSVLYHIIGQHHWADCELYHSCSHKELTPQENKATKWLKKQSPAYERLREIVKNTQLTKDLPKLSKCCHTGPLLHSVVICLNIAQTGFGLGEILWRLEQSWLSLLTTTI
ncbi:LOW QUALITY PROTEIN: uncharacterized protein WCC33_013324 [Rhinophrynus dorsalis]